MFTELKRWIKIIKIKAQCKNVRFGSNANIGRNSVFEGQNKIGAGTWFDGYIGYGSYIGDRCSIFAKIGKFCSIGHKVTVLTGTHPSHIYVSTHPSFFSLEKQNGTTFVNCQKFKEKLYADEKNKYGVIIGNDVWIGYNATIIGGITVGDGAIIAAGAFVKEDVPSYAIVAGQPARVVGKRFTDEQIEFLKKFQWWNNPIEWIKDNADKFDNVENFFNKFK